MIRISTWLQDCEFLETLESLGLLRLAGGPPKLMLLFPLAATTSAIKSQELAWD